MWFRKKRIRKEEPSPSSTQASMGLKQSISFVCSSIQHLSNTCDNLALQHSCPAGLGTSEGSPEVNVVGQFFGSWHRAPTAPKDATATWWLPLPWHPAWTFANFGRVLRDMFAPGRPSYFATGIQHHELGISPDGTSCMEKQAAA